MNHFFMSHFPILLTDRLCLREIVDSDAPAIWAIHSDPAVMHWYGNDPLNTLEDARNLVKAFADGRRLASPATRWGLERRSDGEFIGTCGLFAWHRAWRRCTIGFELAREAQGQGLMFEALQAVIDWAWPAMELHRIEAQVHPENQASRRLLQRLGFQDEGILRELGYWREEYHDMVQCSLLHDDWNSGLMPR